MNAVVRLAQARYTPPMVPLTSKEIRGLKARAQLLKPVVRLGKQGLSPEFVAALDEALTHHELVKVKFDEFKEERKQLAPQMAERTGSQFIWMVGHVAVFYRPRQSQEP
jgi:RNA-binding protein